MKVLSKVIYPWAFSNRFTGMKDLIESFSKPRGIVLTFGNGGFEQGLLNIMHIRKNLNCYLPVQVFYNGLQDLDQEKAEALNRIDGVSTKNLQEVFGGIAEDRNFHSKPYAILASSFKEVIYIDDDVVLFQNPERLLEDSRIFQKYGSLFFKGRSYDFGNSKWVRWFIKSPSFEANKTGRYFRDLSKDEMDASLMLFDKSKISIVHGLLSACHLNLREVREVFLGDKETYWLAFELLRVPYKFAPGIAGAAGSLQEKDGKIISNSVCGPQSHLDEFGKLLHVNSRSARYNHELDKWEKTLSHYIAPQSEIPGNIDSTQQPWCVSGGEGGSKEVFEVGQKEKEVLLKLRDLSMELRHENWKHYLENHL
ncbi:mannosyltransferase putative-domain-containing protein [Obelidium mucronatum]|nr:mannosyltransferase putative-domain-containing protein [Obelidium mucronatum]